MFAWFRNWLRRREQRAQWTRQRAHSVEALKWEGYFLEPDKTGGHGCGRCYEQTWVLFTKRYETAKSGEVFVDDNRPDASVCLRCQTVWPFMRWDHDDEAVHVDCWTPPDRQLPEKGYRENAR